MGANVRGVLDAIFEENGTQYLSRNFANLKSRCRELGHPETILQELILMNAIKAITPIASDMETHYQVVDREYWKTDIKKNERITRINMG